MLFVTTPPPPPLRGTSPSGGGKRVASSFFPPKRGKWLSVSETDGGEKRTRNRARALRKRMTNAELILWSRLRKRQMLGLHFRRQHPIGPYIADFACKPLKLVIEVDGDTHGEDVRAYDRRRTAFMAERGWRVLRFFNVEIYENLDGVIDRIGNVLKARRQAALLNSDKQTQVDKGTSPGRGKDT